MKEIIKRFFLDNYRKNKRFILLKFRHDVLMLIAEKWFQKKLQKSYYDRLNDLKNGDSTKIVFHLQGGGNSYQRRKQRRLIMRNLVSNYLNYSE